MGVRRLRVLQPLHDFLVVMHNQHFTSRTLFTKHSHWQVRGMLLTDLPLTGANYSADWALFKYSMQTTDEQMTK